MALAFVLMNIDIGYEQEVLEAVKKMKGVKEAYITYGVYDLVIKLETKTRDELKTIINQDLRTIGHLRATLTMITV